MCTLCKEINKRDSEQVLALVAERMKEAKDRKEFDHLSEVLDKLLGTEDKSEDTELAKTWYEEKEQKDG